MDTEPEPKPSTEPVAKSVPKAKPEVPADQVCELAMTSVTVGVFMDLDSKEWLIDREKEVVLPTLPTHAPTHKPSLSLVPTCTNECSSPLSSSLPLLLTSPVLHIVFSIATSPVYHQACFITVYLSYILN